MRPSSSRVSLVGFQQVEWNRGDGRDEDFLLRRSRFGMLVPFSARSRLRVDGELFAHRDNLRNVWIESGPGETSLRGTTWRLGQMKLPGPQEAYEPVTANPMVDRAWIIEQLYFQHDRDLGLEVLGTAGPLRYWIAGVGGAGRNRFADPGLHLGAARLLLKGHASGIGTLTVGGSLRYGDVVNQQPRSAILERERVGLELQALGGWGRVRAEYFAGWNRGHALHGVYGLIGVPVGGCRELLLRWDEAVRTGVGSFAGHRITLGANQSLGPYRLMINREWVSGSGPNSAASGWRVRWEMVF